MSDLGNKAVIAQNLRYYIDKSGKTQTEICRDLNFRPSTFSDWVKGNTYPRIDKIESLANYFGINKSDLIEDKKNETDSKFSYLVEQQLRSIGYRILFYDDDAILTLRGNGIEIEISLEDLDELTDDMKSYLRFRTNELIDRVKAKDGYFDLTAKPVKRIRPTAAQKKEDPYTVIAAHNDNEDPDQYELMMEDAADLLDDDD